MSNTTGGGGGRGGTRSDIRPPKNQISDITRSQKIRYQTQKNQISDIKVAPVPHPPPSPHNTNDNQFENLISSLRPFPPVSMVSVACRKLKLLRLDETKLTTFVSADTWHILRLTDKIYVGQRTPTTFSHYVYTII